MSKQRRTTLERMTLENRIAEALEDNPRGLSVGQIAGLFGVCKRYANQAKQRYQKRAGRRINTTKSRIMANVGAMMICFRLGLSHVTTADFLGVSTSTIQRWQRQGRAGKAVPRKFILTESISCDGGIIEKGEYLVSLENDREAKLWRDGQTHIVKIEQLIGRVRCVKP
jgi:transposase